MVENPATDKISHVIGLMSGTSLDGVDLAFCSFRKNGKSYDFQIEACETVPYNSIWRSRLVGLPSQDALTFVQTHVEYGRYLGQLVKSFVDRNNLKPGFVASHGHTIFHQPLKGFTSQIGDGAALAAECGLPVVCDFRSSDVAYGGQGAPLVPIGDELLFGKYDCCLNLGGFGNISFKQGSQRIAFDTCPVNILLNFLAEKAGLDYDRNGELAASGKVIPYLLEKLNSLPYYQMQPPKSLGREWIEKEILTVLPVNDYPLNNIMRTFVEHIALQISASLPKRAGNMIVTGGGVFNKFLISRIQEYCAVELVIPGDKIINYKEALIFALLGLLRMRGIPNCLPSVTGAAKPAIGGAVYLP